MNAFSNAVPMKRGGSHSRASQRGVHTEHAEPEPAVHDRVRLGLVELAHRVGDVLRGLRDRRLGDDADAGGGTRPAEVRDVRLPDQRLLDEHADLGVRALRKQVRPEDRLVGHRTHRQRERPLAEPVVGAGDADRGDVEALLDRLARRDAVVGDRGPEDGETTLVDELAVRVDDRLDRSLREALDLAEHDLDGSIDRPVLEALLEHQLERLRQVRPRLLRVGLGQDEVEEVPELDRLGGALVGHGLSAPTRSRAANLIVVPDAIVASREQQPPRCTSCRLNARRRDEILERAADGVRDLGAAGLAAGDRRGMRNPARQLVPPLRFEGRHLHRARPALPGRPRGDCARRDAPVAAWGRNRCSNASSRLGTSIAQCAIRHRAALLLTYYEPPAGSSPELVRLAHQTPAAIIGAGPRDARSRASRTAIFDLMSISWCSPTGCTRACCT